ncbi:unnamed protein product [Rotaria magnacalcarata]|uniref:EGF-like domain-containing protein n=2 Tax=Rotaria magnacalcarata TaxID=392030 RepID=A0A816XMB7_9BILA|nr:unnamed protein product [Rotaria magnacalcarata]
MFKRAFFLILTFFLIIINNVQTTSTIRRNHETFQLLKETKAKVKHGAQCISPSKYFAGSCYTYANTVPAPSWERAYNNCLSSSSTINDSNLLAIESVDEYRFIERELIGLKSGSESVSVYIGLRKINSTWLWSNDIPLKETPVYRFWVDNNRDILAYDCGIMWLAKNTSVITPAPCVEQALRPYVCKQTIDRCHNHRSNCGKYGKCIDLPMKNSHQCQCRFFYTGDQCEKWSNQGLQIIIGGFIALIAFIISYIIDCDGSDDSWSFKKSNCEQYQSARIHVRNQSNFKRQSSKSVDHVAINSNCINSSTPKTKQRWCTSSFPFDVCQRQYSFPTKTGNLFLKEKRFIFIILSIILTILIFIIIINAKYYIKEILTHSTRLFQFCILYENNYYHNLLTLPIAFVITLLIIINQTRKEYYRLNKEKLSIYIPIPFNPFSKINRFDTMILCGIVSHEILEIIEEIFLKTTQMKLLAMTGPLFDLIRQIGLIIIVGLRYYPVYSVLEISNDNILYYVLCSFYMWLDLFLRIFEQVFCVQINSLVRTWKKIQQLKHDLATTTTTATTMLMSEYESFHSEGSRGHFHRLRDRLSFRGTKFIATTIGSVVQPFSIHEVSSIPYHSLNWSSLHLNTSMSIHHNDSQSTFDQFGIDRSIVCVFKYAPYYLCLTYICCRLTYLVIISLYRRFVSCENAKNSLKKPLKHIYHKPIYSFNEILSIEYLYVRRLFEKSFQNLGKKHISLFKTLLHKIYRPNKYFHYSKQILNMYMIAFMLIYYLTFNILQNGFSIIDKLYSFVLIPLLILYDELDLPEPKPINLKYEMILACILTTIIYFVQLLFGMKNYQKHMLDAYRGVFIDIPPRAAFRNVQLMLKNVHYPGYCIAHLTCGYIIIGNILFFVLIALHVLFKHLFLIEEIARTLIPLLVIYLTTFIIQWFLSKTFFVQKHGKTIVLKNLRIYFVFAYFNFFFDCFLGIISCVFRVTKAWITSFCFLPRLDYSILGRSLEKMDSGFISYASFIHMECLHTHPVLVYFCSIVDENINKRYQYLRTSKRDIYLYTKQQQTIFRWWLAITLSRNRKLIQYRKYQFMTIELSRVDSFNEIFEKKFLKSYRIKANNQENIHSNMIIRNHTTTCTTLLLDIDEQDDRKPSF